jgi:hypothetical protein
MASFFKKAGTYLTGGLIEVFGVITGNQKDVALGIAMKDNIKYGTPIPGTPEYDNAQIYESNTTSNIPPGSGQDFLTSIPLYVWAAIIGLILILLNNNKK